MRLLPALLIVCLGTLMFAGYRVALAEPANPTPTARFTSESWDTEPAAGMLLVAARELRDPFFGQSVILLLQHDITGSKGLILNRLSDWRLSDVVSDIDGAQADADAVENHERITVDDVLIEVGRQEAACVVACRSMIRSSSSGVG